MSLLKELQRRNVIRVATAYVVVAWLIIQVVETIFPAFGFSDKAVRIVVIVFSVGFIPTLIIAWVFEFTPDGSIAVLPFVNMSSDPDQEFFVDGIAEEVLNLLAQIRELRVISRSSAFTFKGKDIDIREIAAQLDVGHILEGSV